MTTGDFKALALSFSNTIEQPHFDRTAFKVVKRRIFATLHEPSGTANVFLTPLDQSTFCLYNKEVVYPVPNKWGLKGATTFVLKKVPRSLMRDALQTAYNDAVAPRPRSDKKNAGS